MGVTLAPQVQGLDTAVLLKSIQNSQLAQILDHFDDRDGEQIEVFLE